MGMGTRALGRAKAGATAATTAVGIALFSAAPTWAQDLMGQPTPGGIDLQPAAAPLKHDAIWFHDIVLPRASEIRFIRGRLKFGDAKNVAPFPSMIVVFRNGDSG